MWGRFSDLKEIRERLTGIEDIVAETERNVNTMADTLADLDAAIDAFVQAQTAAQAEIQKAVQDILAKVSPAVDVSAEVAKINAATASEKAAADAIAALDVTPPTP